MVIGSENSKEITGILKGDVRKIMEATKQVVKE